MENTDQATCERHEAVVSEEPGSSGVNKHGSYWPVDYVDIFYIGRVKQRMETWIFPHEIPPPDIQQGDNVLFLAQD